MAVRIAKTAIISIAQQTVGRGSELNTICDDKLNLIVGQLYENFSWPSNQKSGSITLTAGLNTWTVPTDYVKGLFGKLIVPNSSPQTELTLPILSFINYGMIGDINEQGQPQVLNINRQVDTTGEIQLIGTVWPVPNQTYSGKLYYHAIQIYDVADGNAPAFLDIKTLVELLVNELRGMGYGSDIAIPYDPAMLEKITGRMRRNISDEGIFPQRAKLDGRMFGRGNKSYPWLSGG